MSPIPERDSISPRIFDGLKGANFIDTYKAINFFSTRAKSAILVPPDQEVMLYDNQIPYAFQKRILTGFSEAILFRGKDFSTYYNYLMSNIVPKRPSELNKANILSQLFGLKTSFDKNENIIGVSRADYGQIQFRHSNPGLTGNLSSEHQHALLALSLVPDKLWKDIYYRGLVVGILFGGDYDVPWKVESKSCNLPVGRSLRSTDFPGRLTTFSMEKLGKAKRAESTSKAFDSLNLVGVFFDFRSRDT